MGRSAELASKVELALALADEFIIVGILLFGLIAALAYFGLIALWAAIVMAVVALSIVSLFAYITFKPQLSRPKVGMEAMLGKKGTATSKMSGTGMILIDGEYWRAVSDDPIDKDEDVEVVGVEGLRLKVRKARPQ